jgi:hypothetical protein
LCPNAQNPRFQQRRGEAVCLFAWLNGLCFILTNRLLEQAGRDPTDTITFEDARYELMTRGMISIGSQLCSLLRYLEECLIQF